MAEIPNEDLEQFINDYMKEDLKQLERHINVYNDEIMELVQLKNTIEAMQENLDVGFKTQLNIGGTAFMVAEVDRVERILIDVGKHCFVELTLDEALRFLNFKIAVLTKECQVCRGESIKKRTNIKLALIYMAEKGSIG